MLIESAVSDDTSPSDRTRLALLSLRLRALQDEIRAAEALSAGWDHEAAQAQLSARLESLLSDRRRAIEVALGQARAEAEQAIAAARIEADRIRAGQRLEATVTEEAPPVLASQPGTIKVNFDTEALAAAIVSVLESRPNLGYQNRAPEAPKATPKKSVAGSLVQPDVVLGLISLLIVISILLAWAT